MKNYYHENDLSTIRVKDERFAAVENPDHLYDLMQSIWCEYSCAPRLRVNWSKENNTLGQCSITSFLIQDIFEGEVYGVELEDGSYHCFNVCDGIMFDLTSEQFDHPCVYTLNYPQSRDVHFASEEKKERYEYLKRELLKAIGQ